MLTFSNPLLRFEPNLSLEQENRSHPKKLSSATLVCKLGKDVASFDHSFRKG